LLTEADDFEPLHEPQSNILCFRHIPASLRGADEDRVNEFQRLVRGRWNSSGRGWITATALDRRRVLRVTLMNPATRHEHLEALVSGLREVGEGL
jgi:L-2,4-diaminobutyrate decarboxylase